jgi:hypothetical protein
MLSGISIVLSLIVLTAYYSKFFTSTPLHKAQFLHSQQTAYAPRELEAVLVCIGGAWNVSLHAVSMRHLC